MSTDDRHITICLLNEALAPDYEVRFCIDSNGSDKLAFLPLPTSTWQEMEKDRVNELASGFIRSRSGRTFLRKRCRLGDGRMLD